MKTTEQELDEYMKGRTSEDHVAMQDTEAAIRWLCRRLDEMKAEHARLADELHGARRDYNILAGSVDEMARVRRDRASDRPAPTPAPGQGKATP